MLKRLKTRDQFVRLNKEGKKWVSRSVIVQVAKNCDDAPRVGFTATKRTSKLAVDRNRIKRRMSAAAQDVLSKVAKGGFDYVLIGRPATLSVPYATLCNDLNWCLKRLAAP